MEAGGVESHLEENKNLSINGQDLSTTGRAKSQSLNIVNVVNASNVELGTKEGTSETPSGHPKNAIGTQQEHNRSTTELTENQDLKKIIDAWQNLPEAMKQGILAMIEAVVKKS